MITPLLLAAALTLQSAAPTDWRTLPVDSYPAEARAQIAPARDALLRQPESAETAGQLAMVLHAWEQFDWAEAAYARARELGPDEVAWWALSGTLAARVGRHDKAAEYFGKANTMAPSPLLALRHGDALLESGRLEAARQVYEAAARLREAEPAALYGLGRIAMATGDHAAARASFERAVSLMPAFGAAHYALAQLHRKAGDMAAARAAIARQQQCLACWPMPADPYQTRLEHVRTDAAALLRRGIASAQTDQAEAIALHERALERDPTLLQARVNLITLYAQTGNLVRAEEQYRAVVASGTHVAEAHQAFGLALVQAREPARAEPVLRLAVQANPHDARSHNALGLIEETSDRLAEAEASYRRATTARPEDRSMRFNLARVLVNRGRLDEALEELRALETPADAESARYLFAAAAAYVRKGNLAEGRRLGEEALARARRYGLTDLAASIARDLQKIR